MAQLGDLVLALAHLSLVAVQCGAGAASKRGSAKALDPSSLESKRGMSFRTADEEFVGSPVDRDQRWKNNSDDGVQIFQNTSLKRAAFDN